MICICINWLYFVYECMFNRLIYIGLLMYVMPQSCFVCFLLALLSSVCFSFIVYIVIYVDIGGQHWWSWLQWRSKALRGPDSIVTWGASLSLPSTSPPPSFPPLSQPSPSPCREAAPQIQLGGLGERCKLPQRGLGRSHSRNRIWCILALKSVILWQQF